MKSLDRMCVHTITTKPWSLEEAIEAYQAAGVRGITVWRDAIAPYGKERAGRMLERSDLEVVSLARGGFFPAESEEERREAIDENRRAIDEAAAIGAPIVVLVCGAVPGMTLDTARGQIREGIAVIAPHAKECGVQLAIEPLHPMYADSRSAVVTLAQANDMVEALSLENVGVAVDVYHLWWDPALEKEIERAGDSILAFHVCDWRTPTRELLTDRGLMGEGCINVPRIRGWVEKAGFSGFNEVEIFSEEYWVRDQGEYLNDIVRAYREHV
ncbi:MAG: sugar phosphate isomerase/epimerase family protein [Candidatus Sumerlaeota bacterium]